LRDRADQPRPSGGERGACHPIDGKTGDHHQHRRVAGEIDGSFFARGKFRFFGAAADENELNAPALAALAQVGLAERASVPAAELSHGEKRALELAIALAMEPKLLLLDEPMAGTGRDETDRLVAVLRSLKGRFPMVLVEHDMTAVFALADRISVMIYGKILASGPPDLVRADPQVVTAYLGEEME
jgi:branched-chain amino acid transport system ATP-binding protein